ncbi:MAG: DUF2190 domain-containing protein [Gammaproteobacteria bacterium]|nr:DUF2190 domain-containing protein [Gammaproteobacteria bacterium]
MAAGAASAAGARADGPVLMRGDSGDAVPICTIGTAQAVAGGAVATGAQLEVGTDGKVVTKSAGVVVAKARESAAADGDEIEVFVMAN